MPARNWWTYTTPTQRRALTARNWRRQSEAALFRARNDTNTSGSLHEVMRDRLTAQRQNPLAPGPQTGAKIPELKNPLPKAPAGSNIRPRQSGTRGGGIGSGVPNPLDAVREVGSRFVQGVTEPFGIGVPGFGGTASGRRTDVTGGVLSAPITPIVGEGRLVDVNLPGPLNRIAEEASRPTTLIGALVPGLSFAPGAGFVARLAAETAGGIAADEAAARVPGPAKPFVGIAAGAAGGLGTVGAIRGGAAGLRAAGIASPREIIAAARRPAPLRPGESFARAEIVPGGEDALNNALDTVKRTLREQIERRRSGVTGAEIQQNRAAQFGSVFEGLEEAQRQGLSGLEASRFARGGTRGGTLSTGSGPLAIPQQARDAIIDRANTALREGRIGADEYLNQTTAFEQALSGTRQLQPGEIDAVARLIGDDELASLLTQRNAVLRAPTPARPGFRPRRTGLPGTENRLPRAGEQVNIGQRGGVGQQQIRRSAQQAAAREQADVAAQRAFEAGQLETRNVPRPTSNAPGIGNVANETIPPASVTEPTLRRAPAVARKAHERAQELQRAGERQSRQFRRARQQEIAATNVMNRPRIEAAQLAADWSANAKPRTVVDRVRFQRAQEARNALDAAVGRSDEEFIAAVRQLSGAEGMTLTDAQIEAIDLWLKGNRARLDMLGPEGITWQNNVAAFVRGDFSDPFLNLALRRRSDLASVLRSTGMDEKQVRTVTRNLFNNELRVHYRGEIPREVLDAIRRDTSLHGNFAAINSMNQMAKNMMFSTDIGIVGQQGNAAIRYGGWQGFLGFINRKLAGMGHPLVNLTDPESALTRQQRYMLDGLHYGTGPSAVQIDEAGNIVTGSIKRLNDLQFGTILGTIREGVYEGELAITDLLSRVPGLRGRASLDIANPAVRARLADNANHITSFAHEAVRANRAATERIGLLSPSMTRSQIARLDDMAKLLKPGVSADERISAAMMILSYATQRALVGGLLNSWVGVGPFEWDPSKPGSGQITMSNGVVFNLFSQESFNNAVAQSVRVILEEDPGEVSRIWGRFLLGRTSFAGNVVGAATGYGYEAGSGFRFGDMTARGRIEAILPVPPLASSIVTEGYNLNDSATQQMLGLESLGIQSFQESPSTEERRVIESAPNRDQILQQNGVDPQAPYEEIPKNVRELILQDAGVYEQIQERRRADIEQQASRGDPQGRALELTYLQRDALTELANQVGDDRAAYREGGDSIRTDFRARRSEYDDVFESFGDPKAEQDILINRYWGLYDEAIDPTTGLLDSDKLDQLTSEFRADVGDERFREILTAARQPDPLDNPLEQERQAVLLGLELSGYWDMRDEAWQQLSGRLERLGRDEARFKTYDDYRQSWVANRTNELEPRLGDAAQARAELEFNSTPVKQALDEYVSILRENWIQDNQDLANYAIAWRYLSPSVANIYSTTGQYVGSGGRGGGLVGSTSSSPAGAGSTSFGGQQFGGQQFGGQQFGR